ncbi:Flavodoxin reductases (ferredoxin-NADPH reductases) family 1 [Marinobacterium lacunae]|uniref:Flavodoxin reductases (Ferredoxin-NADPH reductases) family 1 n=1 Tax=Marinobacterium lacunae TaxID=1232683 RepID=A0A081G086_9GAMM|nr:PDR/VanB family oxidoreductase [Marinobacterium lacunae]KEA64191.1 Flavodoxin reductases (ferredoxin-NADPH reductases) family 1 [Marinobacterium lacunae]
MSIDKIRVQVTGIEQVAPLIREFQLKAVDAELMPFSPGSHVVVEMPDTPRPHRNAYSLLSDPRDGGCYRIAVRLQEHSRGGSRYMHEQVKVGDELWITPPANLFSPLWQASKHILIAGGVGITPFMSYLPELEREGAHYELHYLYRGKQTGAYREQLQQSLGERCFLYDADAGARCDLRELLSDQPRGSHAYICGPQSLIAGVQEVAAELGWPASYIHFEAFAAPQPGNPFEVELSRSGRTLKVAADTSLLEALEEADVPVTSLCRGGVCGQCLTPVVSGDIEHRDEFLTAAEREKGNCMMPCVSRAAGKRLVLDL